MKEECKSSWRKCEEKRKAAANQRVESNDKLEARRKEFEENEAKKFERVKGKILTFLIFSRYLSSSMANGLRILGLG